MLECVYIDPISKKSCCPRCKLNVWISLPLNYLSQSTYNLINLCWIFRRAGSWRVWDTGGAWQPGGITTPANTAQRRSGVEKPAGPRRRVVSVSGAGAADRLPRQLTERKKKPSGSLWNLNHLQNVTDHSCVLQASFITPASTNSASLGSMWGFFFVFFALSCKGQEADFRPRMAGRHPQRTSLLENSIFCLSDLTDFH